MVGEGGGGVREGELGRGEVGCRGEGERWGEGKEGRWGEGRWGEGEVGWREEGERWGKREWGGGWDYVSLVEKKFVGIGLFVHEYHLQCLLMKLLIINL